MIQQPITRPAGIRPILCRATPAARRGFWRMVALTVSLVFVGLGPLALLAGEQQLGQGQPWATPYYVRESGAPGPTVLVVGGIHGNEPAGQQAADQIRHWPLCRGRLVVLPRANIAAVQADRRTIPDVDAPLRDLNRNFPRAGQQEPPRGELAEAIWELVRQIQPDWLIDLHEGVDFRQQNPQSVGNTLIPGSAPAVKEASDLMLQAVNAEIDQPQQQFIRLKQPVDGSLARAAGEHLGVPAMILETTRKGQPLSRRIRQHRIMLHQLLAHLEMIGDQVSPTRMTGGDRAPDRIRVALYDAGGSAGQGVPRVRQILSQEPAVQVLLIGPEDIRDGALEQFQVVIFSGGSGSGQAAALQESGGQQVRHFVEQGGGYIGICAGAYLACDGFSWGLKVINAKTVSSKWQRGRGLVQMELTEAGQEIFGDLSGPLDVRYANGPIIQASASAQLDPYQPLAVFRSELAENGSPAGVMLGSPAIAAGRCGAGRVICFSPHPEQTAGLEPLIQAAVAWVAESRDPPAMKRCQEPL